MTEDNKWPLYGYIAIKEAEAHLWPLKQGAVLASPSREPPWLVMHRYGAYFSEPYRLFFVKALNEISNDEQIRFDGGIPITDRYIRLFSAQIIEELDPVNAYGANGNLVQSFLNRISSITCPQAAILGVSRHQYSDQVRHDVAAKIKEKHRNLDPAFVTRHFPNASPFAAGYEIYNLIGKRADQLMGQSAWLTYPDDPEGAELVSFWGNIYDPVFDAVIAIGAGDCISAEDTEVLLHAWNRAGM